MDQELNKAISLIEERVNELMEWADIRGWNPTEEDREAFTKIVSLATSDGYRAASDKAVELLGQLK